jgi:hypothetical protein
MLSHCTGPNERAECVLRLIGRHTQSQAGYLYTLQDAGPVLVAHYGTVLPPASLDRLVAAQLAAALEDQLALDLETQIIEPERAAAPLAPELPRSDAWAGYTIMLLSHAEASGLKLIGLAVMLSSRQHPPGIPHRLLSALTKGLIDTGDVATSASNVWHSRFPPALAND